MRRRAGVTLVEVLVAIFVMGIGLIALLTLFPIGILRMAQAIRDSRTATCAANADRIAKIQDVRNDLDVITDGINPDFFVNPLPGAGGLPNADPYAESYPILADPIGFLAVPTPDWVGGPGNAGILRRRPVEFARRNGLPQLNLNVLRFFSLWDDMVWEGSLTGASPAGTPQLAGAFVLRDPRYSWAYLLRRPQSADRSVVDCTVVVFDQRTLSLTASQTLPETVYPGTSYFNPANSTITIDYTASIPPPVRPGQWILDATFYKPTPTTGSASAFFYKVVASEDFVVAGKNYVRFEVQQPIRGRYNLYPSGLDPLGSGNPVYQGTIIVMEGIADVFEKGPARLP